MPAVVALAGPGTLFTFAALVFGARFAGAGVAALAVEYVIVLATNRTGAPSLVAYAAGLVVLAEVLFWTAELRFRGLVDGAVVIAFAIRVGAAAAAGAVLAVGVLAAARLRLPGLVWTVVVGCAAAVTLLAIPWLLLRRGRGGEPDS